MLKMSPRTSAPQLTAYANLSSQLVSLPVLSTSRFSVGGPPYSKGGGRDTGNRSSGALPAAVGSPIVQISPRDCVKRHCVAWHGMQADLVQYTSPEKIEFRSRASRHLLIAHEQGSRRGGETFVEGLPRSTRRDLARKLTLVPAGHAYYEWHEPSAPVHLIFFHFDTSELGIHPAQVFSGMSPRLHFEDSTLWATVSKLKRLLDAPVSESRLHLEALGVVLVHELARLDRGTDRSELPVRGGLASWQQRTVAAYIEEHLADQIPLATLAKLARLSPYHFCRAFKQSFGLPPHRYHTRLRIERAKLLLAQRPLSVTQIGLTLGFSETSSFTAAFRRETGQTPSGYHRTVA